VAAVENVDPQFLGQRPGPVRAFAGDKRIHPFRRRARDASAGATGDDADLFANTRPTTQKRGRCTEDGF